MNTIVCLKQVIDPEAPPADFKIDPVTNRMIAAPGVQFVVDPFAECAIEAALRIKDVNGGKVTAISLGPGQARDVVKKPLTLGADGLILLEDMGFAAGGSWSICFELGMRI